ncbi:hypothetical protein F4859DRAFT_224484 [Xylaria cf. heliscus]|nr:hypothetical protein F4859DRAFT_224484 [Xylaria cf. heliscus]
MLVSQPKAKRKGGPRSKGGCGKCKARHVKCDETKPHCRRCLEIGKACDGYSAAAPNNKAPTALTAPPIAEYAIPFRIPGSQQDRRLLHYYCVQGADSLSGHLSSEFWTRLVLQHSHDHLPVRQAVVALSCAHQYYVTAHHSGAIVPADAMVHYNKAMRSLRKYMSAGIDKKEEVSVVVPLICSVLFFCFENTQGNTEAAIRHLNSGIAILARQKEQGQAVPSNYRYEHLDLLEKMLARFDLQASMFDDTRPPLTRMAPVVGPETSAPDTFKTIDDAQADLTRLQSTMLQFLISNNPFKFCPEHELPEKLKLEKQAIEEAYTRWIEKLNRSNHDKSTPFTERNDYYPGSDGTGTRSEEEGYSVQVLESAQDPVIAILLIHYYVFRLLLAANFPYDPSVFNGPSNSENANMLNNVLDLIESTPQAQGAGNRSLEVETGIVAPLFLVVMKCTDPAIFKRAFGLLSGLRGRREGMFDSRVLAEISLRIMSQYDISRKSAALEWQAGNALDESVDGLDGLAKNLGIML